MCSGQVRQSPDAFHAMKIIKLDFLPIVICDHQKSSQFSFDLKSKYSFHIVHGKMLHCVQRILERRMAFYLSSPHWLPGASCISSRPIKVVMGLSKITGAGCEEVVRGPIWQNHFENYFKTPREQLSF